MNDAQKRLAKRVLSMNSSRKDKKQDLNSSLYDKRTFNELREGLADYPADKLKLALSGYITDPIYITNVTNDNGNITVNYRFLDENLNEEFVNAEIGYGLDYIENIHLYASRKGINSGRTPMVHRLKSVNSSKMTADQAKQKYKELLTQCYISVYDHKLDVNDPQVIEYRKQMNAITAEFGDLANTMDGYIKSLDKKYKNTVDFTAEDLDSSKMTADEAKNKYKELLTNCYIAVYDHKLDVNDAQVVEYRKQMKKLTDEFGDIASTMDRYIASLDKKYKNKVNFVELSLDSGLFSKKEKPSEEILKMYKQLKKSIDNLIKAGTPASNSNLKNMQNKATEFEKKYDGKALKMALAASRRGLNSSAESSEWKETYHVNHDRTLASMVHYNDVTGEYDGEVVWIDENGKPQQKTYKGKYNPRLAFAPFVSYWITQDTKQTTVEESDASAYIEACSNIKEAVKNKWTSENSSRRRLNCMWQGNTYDDPMIYFTLIPNDVHDTKAVVRGGVHEYTGDYSIELIYLNDNQNQVKAREITGTFPTDYVRYSFNRKDYDVEKDADMFDDLNNINEAKLLSYIKKVVKDELGTDAFHECDDDKVEARALENLEETARYNRNVNSSRQWNTEEDNYDQADWADETFRKYTLKNRDVHQPMAVKFIITEGTGNYNGEILTLDKDRNLVRESISGSIPRGADDVDEVINDYADVIGDTALYECNESEYDAQVESIKDTAAEEKAIRESNIQLERERKFFDEYGVKPDEWNPFDELMKAANSSRRRRMNSSRRRLNSAVARRSGNDDYQTYYFITEDGSLVASFDVSYNDSSIDYTGFIRGYSADNYVIDERYVMDELATDTDVARALADRVYDLTGVDVYETNDTAEFTAQLREINKIFRNANRG